MKKLFIFSWLVFLAILSCILLFLIWNGEFFKYIEIASQASFKTYAYTFLGGVLGGLTYAFRGFYKSVIGDKADPSKNFDFKWCYWYLIRPLTSGIFGFVIYALLRSGLVAFGFSVKDPGQSNLMFFSLSFMAGFGFHQFAEFLLTKIKNIFQS